MTPELTAVVPSRSWQMPEAVVALDWSSDGRILAVAADGAVAVDGGPPADGLAGHDVAVAGCWAGPTHHARGYRDGTIAFSGRHDLHAIAGDAGPLAAMVWTGTELVAAHRHQLAVIGAQPPSAALDLGAGQLRALAAVTPSYLVAVGADDTVFVDTGLRLVDARVDLEGGISVAADPHGRYVAVGDLAGSIHLIIIGRVGDGCELTGYPDMVRHLACSAEPAGVIATADDELTFWAVSGGELADEPMCAVGHEGSITALAVSSTGPLVATGDAGGQLCLWDLRGLGRPVWQCNRTGAAVTAIAWSVDGDRLAVGDVRGGVGIWTVMPGTIA